MVPRPLTPADLEALETLRPADWPPFRETYLRYFDRAFCGPFGIDCEGRLAATGTLIQFGTSGWLGQIITGREFRGRGLGTRMVAHLVEEAGRRGLRTLSLVATDEGWPLYARAGFRVEGEYEFWTRKDPAPAEPGACPGLTAAGGWEAALGDLDCRASGERREGWLGPLSGGGWRSGSEGWFLPRAGEGLVLARTVRAGVGLLHKRIDGSERVVVPAENRHAQAVLEGRGFAPVKRARRMVLGPSLDRKPEWVWSRIAGNLG